jgi:hypothetical protein
MLVGGPKIKAGHFQADGNTYKLKLDFVPDYIRLYNLNATAGEVMLFEYFGDMGDRMISSPTLAIGSTKSKIAHAGFRYKIAGVEYEKEANVGGTSGIVPGDDVIVQAKYGAVALDIGADGVVDVIEATDQAAQQFTSAAAAMAAVVAPAAGHARMGYITVTDSNSTFTFGTDNFDGSGVTAQFLSCLENAIATKMLADNGTTGKKTIENLLTLGALPATFDEIARLEQKAIQITDPIKVTPENGVQINTDWMDDDDEVYFLAFGTVQGKDIGDVA